MNLKKKLEQLKGRPLAQGVNQEVARDTSGYAAEGSSRYAAEGSSRHEDEGIHPYEIDRLVQGMVHQTTEGACYCIENKYPLSYIYGDCCLGDISEGFREGIKDVFPGEQACQDISNIALSQCLFLDTETTGLSGGAGTVAFLIGAGYFLNDCFVLKQYLMRDYDEEPALLHLLNNELSGFKALITFNGKSFDWNLLLNRFIFYRMRPSLKNPVHLDLLFTSRRIWKLTLENCRLCTIEEQILGERRVDDVEGYLIPSVYFKYLLDRDARQIVRVINHNSLDILSLVALLNRVLKMFSNPFDGRNRQSEIIGLGLAYERSGKQDMSALCFLECLEHESLSLRNIAFSKLALLYKKMGDFSKAVKLWEEQINGEKYMNPLPYIELAKYYEHRENDYKKAICIVEKVMDICNVYGISREKILMKELQKRRDRLKKKILSGNIK